MMAVKLRQLPPQLLCRRVHTPSQLATASLVRLRQLQRASIMMSSSMVIKLNTINHLLQLKDSRSLDMLKRSQDLLAQLMIHMECPRKQMDANVILPLLSMFRESQYQPVILMMDARQKLQLLH